MKWPTLRDNCTQLWSESKLVPGVICHVCGSSEEVHQGTVESLIHTKPKPIKTSFLAHWRLCIECSEKGWQIPIFSHMGNMIYANPETRQNKSLKTF